jgi:hypothetical protein
MKNEFKRVKHGQIPGDLGRKSKIAMREKRTPIQVRSDVVIEETQAKSFRQTLTEKSKTVQRRRDKKAIKQGIDE